MENIRFRIARCDTLPDDNFLYKKIVCFSVEREDYINNQISVCGVLSGSQCIGKSNEECVNLAFGLMSGSLSEAVNKLLSSNPNIVGSYYVP